MAISFIFKDISLDFVHFLTMIITPMDASEYNFKRCKLCGEMAAEPTYNLGNGSVYSCQNCDFHFLNHLDKINSSSTDSIPLDDNSRKYIESRLDESVRLHPSRMRLVHQYLELTDRNVLDIGAGLGQFQLLLSGQGAKSHGIEPCRSRREYALEKFGVNLHCELIDHPYWQTGFVGHFDLITMWDVIEHVDLPSETLEAAIKLLKPEGVLFLETPSRDVLSYKLSQQVYRLTSGTISLFLPSFYSVVRYGHKQIFTREQITGLLKRLGLEIICSKDSYSTSLLRGDKIILGARR